MGWEAYQGGQPNFEFMCLKGWIKMDIHAHSSWTSLHACLKWYYYLTCNTFRFSFWFYLDSIREEGCWDYKFDYNHSRKSCIYWCCFGILGFMMELVCKYFYFVGLFQKGSRPACGAQLSYQKTIPLWFYNILVALINERMIVTWVP